MEATVFYLLMAQKYINSKHKISETKPHPLCLGNISKKYSVNNMIKTGLNGYVFNFSVG